jgi:hypothetical protein
LDRGTLGLSFTFGEPKSPFRIGIILSSNGSKI